TEDDSTLLTGVNTASKVGLAGKGGGTGGTSTSLTVTTTAQVNGTSISLADDGGDVLSIGSNADFEASTGNITIGAAGAVNFGSLTVNSPAIVTITEDDSTLLTGVNT